MTNATTTETGITHGATIDMRGAALVVEGGRQDMQDGTLQIPSKYNRRNLNPDANIYAPQTAAVEVNLKAIAVGLVN
jgi:hypothetical protein